MKKKFGLGLLITCLLLLVLGFCMESYAYTIDDLISYCEQITEMSNVPTAIKNKAAQVVQNKTYILNYLSNVNAKTWLIYVPTNENAIQIYYRTDSVTINRYDTSFIYTPRQNYSARTLNIVNHTWTNNGDSAGIQNFSKTYYFGLIYSTGFDSWNSLQSDFYFNNKYIESPVFDFTQYGNVHNVTVGNYTDVSVIYYNPTTPIYWGILQNYNELDSNLLSYSLDIMTPDGNDEVLFDYVQWRLIDYGRYYWFTDSSKIYLNRVYKLLVNYDDTEIVYTYYIAPYGSNYSSGDTIGYFYNSGDSNFNTQDATNVIVDALTDTEQVDATLDSLTSGEIYNKLGYTEYHTTWNNFMYDMFTGIETALFSSGDIAFTFPYMRTTVTLHSSDFITPPGLLKGFCSSFLMFGFIVLVYQHIARFYHRLQEGAVNQVVEEFNVDDETLIL